MKKGHDEICCLHRYWVGTGLPEIKYLVIQIVWSNSCSINGL